MATTDPIKEVFPTQETEDDILMQLLKKVDAMSSTLTSLTTTVSTLQEDNNQLQIANTNLKERLAAAENELITIQKNAGGRFILFKKLPKELQIMIWKLAARLPQIHIMCEDGASRSQVVDVMKSCAQAKKAILELKMDYFLVSEGPLEYGDKSPYIPGSIRNYINLDIDTFWITGRRPLRIHCFPDCVQWVCGQCNTYDNRMTRPCSREEGECISTVLECGPSDTYRVAFDFLNWEDPTDDHSDDLDDYGTPVLSYHNEPEEFLIVIGEPGLVPRERDVVFVKPTLNPRSTHHYLEKQPGVDQDSGAMKRLYKYGVRYSNNDPEKTWEDVEDGFRQAMVDYKAERAARRQALVDSGAETWDTIDEIDLPDLSAWYIPDVKFVEARQRSQLREWVVPPPGQAPALPSSLVFPDQRHRARWVSDLSEGTPN